MKRKSREGSAFRLKYNKVANAIRNASVDGRIREKVLKNIIRDIIPNALDTRTQERWLVDLQYPPAWSGCAPVLSAIGRATGQVYYEVLPERTQKVSIETIVFQEANR